MSSYQAILRRFEELNTHVLGISVDSVPSKSAWAASLGGIAFDLLSDFFPHGEVASRYGVLLPGGVANRSLFVADRHGTLAYARVYSIPEQPDIEEVFGVLRKLQATE